MAKRERPIVAEGGTPRTTRNTSLHCGAGTKRAGARYQQSQGENYFRGTGLRLTTCSLFLIFYRSE